MRGTAYHDDLEAAHARIGALERDNRALRGELEGGAGPPARHTRRGPALAVMAVLVLVGIGAVVALGRLGGPIAAAVAAVPLVTLVVMVLVLSRLLCTCGPHEALVIFGRVRRGTDGVARGYRVVLGGRVIRMPFIERVERIDLGLTRVPIALENAYSAGGKPLDVEATAAIRISTEPGALHNAVERFLGRQSSEVAQVARETLEGTLRRLLATIDQEELQADRLKVAAVLVEEASPDFERLGLTIETFELQTIRAAAAAPEAR